jgi:hypothetical protein
LLDDRSWPEAAPQETTSGRLLLVKADSQSRQFEEHVGEWLVPESSLSDDKLLSDCN